jgi:hypothetical protein
MGEIMAALKTTFIALSIVLLINSPVTTAAGELEILSKDDARTLFTMTKEQWVLNVQQAVVAGAAKAMGSPETELSMVMHTTDGDLLIVRPNYVGNLQVPKFLQVMVGYQGQRAALLTESSIQDIIEVTQEQMAPDFRVIGNAEQAQGGIILSFIIDRW